MRGRLWILLVGLLVAAVRLHVVAQEAEPDARTLIQTSLRAMGAENLKAITYSGTTGYVAVPGQNYAPSSDWPANQIAAGHRPGRARRRRQRADDHQPAHRGSADGSDGQR